MLEETYRKLKEIKKRTGITYKWIAREVGVSERSIRRWTDGVNQPHPRLFLELEKVVNRLYEITLKKVTTD